MFVAVSYDISDTKRRNRLHRALKNFGVRVQYSVFECVLDAKDVKRLEAAVRREVKDDDHVRYYHLCESCERQVVALGGVVSRLAPTTVV